ncbi:MBL fold metallo-hydrolase [Rhizobiales bacterium]|uniref:MBL fold metallo-hydrolase n=1 Tax=Hongsoonwoonella zoysiae TaxID=2821844 RepID=UPI001561541B|nr:MBL fold metallo-hydrolase [Hongsoonwoonella zoysiae]NRG18806.1 MBL fold metallo-hydrolase [Hongsoonwoonella zoysiae]
MTAQLEFTILGCGSSGGVPRVGNIWGACDPAEPRNRRLRCALLVRRVAETGTTTVLIDSGPDVRQQLLNAEVKDLDAVVYTHAHADHIHGIDDLRAIAITHRRRVDVYMDAPTSLKAHEAFGYVFKTPEGSNYPPILNEHRIDPKRAFAVEGAGGTLEFLPVKVGHGDIDALGFKIKNVAYLPDVKDISPMSELHFRDLDIWILDALRHSHHPSHLSLSEALEWIKRMAPKQAILTNMHIDLDYRTLRAELPENIEPAYDGLTFSVDA